MSIERPNLYELSNRFVQISYSTTSISGQPLLNYRDRQRQLSFQGSQIRTEATGIGTLVTVDLEFVPDFSTTTLTLLIPTVNLRDDATEKPLRTSAIVTEERSSIAGPGLVDGQVQSYRTWTLSGTAKLVDF